MVEAILEMPIIETRTEKELQRAEIVGLHEAIQYVNQFSRDKKRPIDEAVVKAINKRVIGLYTPDVAGIYRSHDVSISGARFVQPTYWRRVPTEMSLFDKELEQQTKQLPLASNKIGEIITIAANAHYQIARIHPFEDGNGRTARLTVDCIFQRAGRYCIQDWGLRDRYIEALSRSDELLDITPFELLVAKRTKARYQEVKEYLDLQLNGSASPKTRKAMLLDVDVSLVSLDEYIKQKEQKLTRLMTNTSK